jgi:hypothetical protein|tara:strand:- start:1352 stop:1717 length:366 start_codon:yes stop_codon:yes gene_type:complete
MPFSSNPKVQIVDASGDACDDDAGRLNVSIVGGSTTIASGENDTVGTSAEVLTTSTACKHVDIMASVANTGIIYVGGNGVTAATGIALYAGDVYSLDIDNLNDVYVLATEDGENVQYTYYT